MKTLVSVNHNKTVGYNDNSAYCNEYKKKLNRTYNSLFVHALNSTSLFTCISPQLLRSIHVCVSKCKYNTYNKSLVLCPRFELAKYNQSDSHLVCFLHLVLIRFKMIIIMTFILTTLKCMTITDFASKLGDLFY